jgi:hypothetical protein
MPDVFFFDLWVWSEVRVRVNAGRNLFLRACPTALSFRFISALKEQGSHDNNDQQAAY